MKKGQIEDQTTNKKLLDLDLQILEIVGGKSQTEVLAGLAEAAVALLGGVFCVVQPYDQSTDQYLLDQFTTGGDQKAKTFKWTKPRFEGASRTTLKDGLLLIENYDDPSIHVKYPFLKESMGAFKDVMNIKASLGIRLSAEDEAVGVIFLNYAKPQTFTEAKTDLAQSFASRAAFAIKSARLYQESVSYSNDLRSLLEIAEGLTNLIKEPENVVLKSALQSTVKLLNLTRGGIVFHEGFGGRLVASYDARRISNEDIEFTFGDSPLQRLVRNSTDPIELFDVELDERLGTDERDSFVNLGIKSSLIIPLIAKGRTIGSLGLDDCNDSRHFSQREKELAKVLAGFTATAIDNLRLYSVAEEELTAVIETAESLVHKALEPEIDLSKFYTEVMDRTLKLMQFDAGWLLLREGDWTRIVATDEQHKVDKDRVFPTDGSISGLSISRKSLINISDLEHMPDEYRAIYQAPRGSQPMKSELVTPLIVGDEAIGAFNIESERIGAFETRHEEMLKLLSGYVGLTLELARLRHETNALSAIGLDLSRKTEMKDVVKSVLDHSLTFVEGQFGQVLLRTGDKLHVSWTTNDPPTDLDNVVDENDSVSGLAVIEKKPVIVPDVDKPAYFVVDFKESEIGRKGQLLPRKTERPRYKRALEAAKARMYGEFAVPLYLDGNLVGVLNVETPQQFGFSQEQREKLLAYVKTNAKQFSEALQPVLQPEVLERLLRGALARAETNFGQILSLESNELIIVHTSGDELTHPRGKELVPVRVSVDQSVSGRVVKTNAPVYVPNVQDDPNYQRYLGEEMKSELVIPLILGDNVIGVINIESPKLRFFTSDHARVLEPFASQAAIAIDRATRFTNLTFAELGELATDIIHQLNNPIGAIRYKIGLLKRKDFFSTVIEQNPYIGQFIEKIERDLKEASNITGNLRPVIKARVTSPTSLLESIKNAMQKVEWPDNIKVTLPEMAEDITVIANERLTRVFWNLFENSRKAMPDGGDLSITVDTSDSNWVFVKVKDTGQGIPEWRLDLIFDPGETTSIDKYATDHGLGLWWAKTQLENFDGSISVESNLELGTCFTIRLRKS